MDDPASGDIPSAVYPTLPMTGNPEMYAKPVREISEPCIVGIDEAGRGPVVGPMVYAVCYVPVNSESILAEIQVRDSKVTSPEQRADQFKALVQGAGFAWQVLPPQFISACMLRRTKYNLNAVALDSTAALIQRLVDLNIKIHKVFIDTVGPPDSHRANLNKRFPLLDIVVSKKADSLYPCVSAASIIAKVVRDFAVTHWVLNERSDISTDWGSGYPSDPNTTTWLKRNLDPVFGWPDVVRFSWATIDHLLENHVIVDQWPEDRASGACTSCTKPTRGSKRKRTLYDFVQTSSPPSPVKEHPIFPILSWLNRPYS